jgi:hypothetical protein
MKEDLQKMKEEQNLQLLPTEISYKLRHALNGEGPFAELWKNAPHQVLLIACEEMEENAEWSRQMENSQREINGDYESLKRTLRSVYGLST